MKRFTLTGDVLCAGSVTVLAENADEAIAKAEKGDFERVNETHKPFGFMFDGDDDHIEVEEIDSEETPLGLS